MQSMADRPRATFSVRRMLGGVAVAAFLCAAVLLWGRLAYRRSRIDAILRDQVHGYNPGRGFLSEPTPLYVALKGSKPADYARLRADPEAVVRRLLLTIEAGGKPGGGPQDFRMAPGSAALILLREWLDEVDSVALALSARDRLLAHLLARAIPADTQMEALGLVAGLTQRLGLDDPGRRAAIRERVRTLVGREEERWMLHSWASLAGTIGGREELDLLLALARGPDDATFQAAADSGLRATRWPGVFPALGRLAAPPPPRRATFGLALRAWRTAAWALGTSTWEIDWLIWANDGPNPTNERDPWSAWQKKGTIWTGLVRKALPLATRARPDRLALGMPIMLANPRGRAFLLAYAEDPHNPPQLRRKSVHLLKRNLDGIRLLLDTCEDPARRATVGRFFGRDYTNLVGGMGWDMLDANYWPVDSHFKAADAADPSDPRPELRMLLESRLGGPTLNLAGYVADLNAESGSGYLVARGMPSSEAVALARVRAARSRRLLEALTPPPYPEDRVGWGARIQAVYGPIPWGTYLAALERHPDVPGPDSRGAHYSSDPDDLASLFPYQITLPPGTEGPLIGLARDHPESYDAEPLKALLIYGGRWQEAEGVFDLMETILRREPDRLSARDPDLLRALFCRFAVNFGWDVDAWRAWWRREGRGEAEAESATSPRPGAGSTGRRP